MKRLAKLPALLILALISPACSDDDDDGGTQAMRLGVGAACDSDDDCAETAPECLSFKGGYCGLADCVGDDECPSGSKCVTHDDQRNYCFLVCGDKPECNRHRPLEDEANCSSSITFVSDEAVKACVPPS